MFRVLLSSIVFVSWSTTPMLVSGFAALTAQGHYSQLQQLQPQQQQQQQLREQQRLTKTSSRKQHLQRDSHPRSSVRAFVASAQNTSGDIQGGAEHYSRPNIVHITSEKEFQQFLAEDNRLCIIKFYASWCKSCQKMGLQFQRVARKLGDIEDSNGDLVEQGKFRFAEVEYATNIQLSKQLMVKKLPTVMFYSQSKRVDGFPCGPKKFPQLLEKIAHYQSMTLEQLAFEADMYEGAVLGETVLEEINIPPHVTSSSDSKNSNNGKADDKSFFSWPFPKL